MGKQFFLPYLFNEFPEMLNKMVAEFNARIDALAENEIDLIELEVLGVDYYIIKVFAGVAKNHIWSDAIVTFQCMNIPTAEDDYYFEVSEGIFNQYLDQHKTACERNNITIEGK